MKAIGIIVFIFALTIGITFANLFCFGNTAAGKIPFLSELNTEGTGDRQVEKRNVGNFKALEVGGIFQVEVIAQKDFSVEVEADDNLLPLIVTEVRGDTLAITTSKRISTRTPLRVRIGAPDIQGLDVSGASKVSLVNVKNETLSVDASGASKIIMQGETRELLVNMSGASWLNAEELRAENVVIDASGASKADLSVSNDLKADLSGASRVSYSGNPRNLHKKTSGASSVRGR